MTSQEEARIIGNRSLGGGYHRMGLACGPGYGGAEPGQFVTLRFPDGMGPFLRRPFSIHRPIRGEDGGLAGIELLFKVVGPFTRRLSAAVAGGSVDMVGPLGKGFRIPAGADRIFLAGGGIGVAPLVFLAHCLAEEGRSKEGAEVFLGGRSADDILCREIFAGLGFRVHVATEDGGAGQRGLVTRPLAERVATDPPDLICACGPVPMLRAVADLAGARGIPCQVSVETIMACGLGACLGCAVEMEGKPDGYGHVCRDGPVFDAGRLGF